MTPEDLIKDLGWRAQNARNVLAQSSLETRNHALRDASQAMLDCMPDILEANEQDIENSKNKGREESFIDRLLLTEDRLKNIANALLKIEALPDPLGRTLEEWDVPSGLSISRVSVPLGVIGMIFESRPNVVSDASALCLKSGNPIILRPGSESFYSAQAMIKPLHAGLKNAKLPIEAIQLVSTTERAAVGAMLRATGLIDVIIPRGGKSLVSLVERESRLPVFSHLEGICHLYIDKDADKDKACAIALNSKMRRTGVCGAMETLLIARERVEDILPEIIQNLTDAGCELRGDDTLSTRFPALENATEEDWKTEYLAPILSLKIVEDVKEAVAHIACYGSHHTDAIVTESKDTANYFANHIDSAIVMLNTATQFADGEEFGMGAEIGIATGRMHARGPIGVQQLTTFKYVVQGDGQVRAS